MMSGDTADQRKAIVLCYFLLSGAGSELINSTEKITLNIREVAIFSRFSAKIQKSIMTCSSLFRRKLFRTTEVNTVFGNILHSDLLKNIVYCRRTKNFF